jgi:3-oxoacyl-[acyl-carrier protein] reductase
VLTSNKEAMQKCLENKVALVTGAGRGIGRAIALRLAGEGAAIACCDVMLDNAQTVVNEVKALGTKAAAYMVNVTDGKQVTEVCDKIVAEFGHVDILVNNAGVTRDQLLMRMSEQDWDLVLDINLKGAFLCTKALVRPMMKQRGGRIINIASIIGLTGNAGQSNYAASKAGIIGFTKSTARELASRNITVNAIAPGFIETPMTAVLTEEVRNGMLSRIPLGRLGQPEDVANAVLFLASDKAGYITGQVITVDGGMVMG